MKLRNLRKEKNYSLEYVAEKLDVSRQTISKWEADETLPDVMKCKDLAVLYEVSIDYLVLDDTEKMDSNRTGKYIFGKNPRPRYSFYLFRRIYKNTDRF